MDTQFESGPLAAQIAALAERDAVRILSTIAAARRRWAGEPPAWDAELAGALRSQFEVAAPAAPRAADGELARQALLLLAQDEAEAAPLSALLRGPAARAFDLGIVSGTLLVSAALLALQSQVEFERDKNGKWKFSYKKKPTSEAILKPLIQKLLALLPSGIDGK